MSVPNPDPTNTIGSLAVRDSSGNLLGTAAPSTDAWELVVEATCPVTTLTLPAGQWRVRSLVSAECSAEPLRNRAAEMTETITTIASPGSVNTPAAYNEAIRSISGNNLTIRFTISVEKWNSSTLTYDRYGRGETTITVAAQSTTVSSFSVMSQRQVIDNQNDYVRDPSDFNWVLDKHVDAGIKWVRFSYPWCYGEELAAGLTEPHATKLDTIISAIHSRGLKVMVILGAATPCWASTDSGKNCSSFGGRFATATSVAPPSSWTLYEDYVVRFINRYAPDAVEADNEPNSNTYSGLGYTASTFVMHTTHLWNGVKASNHPSTPVVGAVLSLADTSYMQSLYDAGIKDVTDVISIHPYDVELHTTPAFTAAAATDLLTATGHSFKLNQRVVVTGSSLPAPLSTNTVYYVTDITANTFGLALTRGGSKIDLTSDGSGTVGWLFTQWDPRVAGSPTNSARMQGSLVQGSHRIHKVMRANGDGTKPLWLTEWGLTTAPAGFIVPLDEQTKGTYIEAAFRLAAHIPYIEVMGLYTLVDPPGNSSGTGYGSVTTDRRNKPSYDVIKSTIASLQ